MFLTVTLITINFLRDYVIHLLQFLTYNLFCNLVMVGKDHAGRISKGQDQLRLSITVLCTKRKTR